MSRLVLPCEDLCFGMSDIFLIVVLCGSCDAVHGHAWDSLSFALCLRTLKTQALNPVPHGVRIKSAVSCLYLVSLTSCLGRHKTCLYICKKNVLFCGVYESCPLMTLHKLGGIEAVQVGQEKGGTVLTRVLGQCYITLLGQVRGL